MRVCDQPCWWMRVCTTDALLCVCMCVFIGWLRRVNSANSCPVSVFDMDGSTMLVKDRQACMFCRECEKTANAIAAGDASRGVCVCVCLRVCLIITAVVVVVVAVVLVVTRVVCTGAVVSRGRRAVKVSKRDDQFTFTVYVEFFLLLFYIFFFFVWNCCLYLNDNFHFVLFFFKKKRNCRIFETSQSYWTCIWSFKSEFFFKKINTNNN